MVSDEGPGAKVEIPISLEAELDHRCDLDGGGMECEGRPLGVAVRELLRRQSGPTCSDRRRQDRGHQPPAVPVPRLFAPQRGHVGPPANGVIAPADNAPSVERCETVAGRVLR